MKILRNIVIGIIVLVIILVIAVQVVVNMPFVKAKIVTVVQDQVSRKVELGSLRVGFLTGISLKINDFYLYEKNSEEVFLGLEALTVKVKLLPLLGKKVQVGGIEIIKPQITIVKRIDGSFNFSDMMASEPAEEKEATEVVEEKEVVETPGKKGALPKINIAYIKIKDASLVYKIETENGKFDDFPVKGLNILLDNFSLDKPFDLLISSEIGKKASVEFKTKIGAISDILTAPEESPLKATLSLKDFSSNELSAVLPKDILSLMTFSNMNIAMDIDGSLKDGLDLKFNITTDPLGKTNNLAVAAGVKMSVQADLSNVAASQFNAKIQLDELSLKNDLLADTISISGVLDVVPDTVTLKDLTIKAGSSDIKTSATITNYQQFPETSVSFAVVSNYLDINSLLPQRSAPAKSAEQGKAGAKESVKKAETAMADEKAAQDNNMLKKLLLEGTIDFKKIVYLKNTISDLVVNVSIKDGIASLDKLSLGVFEGAIKGTAKVSLVDDPAPFQADLSVQDLNVKEALVANADYDKFSGTLATTLSIKGTGYNTMDQLKQALTGNADITLKDGVLAGKSLKEEILSKMDNPILARLLPGLAKEREKAKSEPEEEQETKIQDLIVSVIIGNGIITLDKMTCGTEDVTLRGNGTVDFDLQSNLKAQAVLTKEFTEALTAGKDLSGTLPYEEGGMVLPVTITDLITNPTILPDISMILQAASKGALKDKLGGLFGGGKEEEGEKEEGGKKKLPLGGILGGDTQEKTGSDEKQSGSGTEEIQKKLPIKLPFGDKDKSEGDGKKKGAFGLF